MPAQFILNLLIAFLWMLFSDEDVPTFSTFAVGYCVGIVIVFLMYRFFGHKFYLHRLYSALKLIFIFHVELFKSGYFVFQSILQPRLGLQPGIFRYKTVLKGEWEVPLLALLLTLTPGSVVMEVTPAGNEFYVHAMDLAQSRGMLLRSLAKFEKAIMEVTR